MANPLPFKITPQAPRIHREGSFVTPVAQTPLSTRQQADREAVDMQEVVVRNRVGDHPVPAGSVSTVPTPPMFPWPAAGPGGALPFRVK